MHGRSMADIEREAPCVLSRATLYVVGGLFTLMLGWSYFGQLDIIATAPGRLVPQSLLQIVQPAESGIVRELLVREGDKVRAGQVLARMDERIQQAETRQVEDELVLRQATLRRIDAELLGSDSLPRGTEPTPVFLQIQAQLRARRQAQQDALAAERSVMNKAEQDLRIALEQEAKLAQTIPVYIEHERVYARLQREGFAGRMMHLDKQRELVEKEQELRAQRHAIESVRATIEQSRRKQEQLRSNYRRDLEIEKGDIAARIRKLEQDMAKHAHRNALLELKAPRDGTVKDLATHTVGSVLQPGTVLMTLVPADEPLRAEVWVSHEDAGFVRVGQSATIKLATYPFQKYGTITGEIMLVSPDAAEVQHPAPPMASGGKASQHPSGGYKALLNLERPHLEFDGKHFALSPGMQLAAEINLGTRTVLEYLLSPVRRTAAEAGRER